MWLLVVDIDDIVVVVAVAVAVAIALVGVALIVFMPCILGFIAHPASRCSRCFRAIYRLYWFL